MKILSILLIAFVAYASASGSTEEEHEEKKEKPQKNGEKVHLSIWIHSFPDVNEGIFDQKDIELTDEDAFYNVLSRAGKNDKDFKYVSSFVPYDNEWWIDLDWVHSEEFENNGQENWYLYIFPEFVDFTQNEIENIDDYKYNDIFFEDAPIEDGKHYVLWYRDW